MTEETQQQSDEVTWVQIVPALVDTVHNGKTEEVRRLAAEELLKLAHIVDTHIASLETLRDAPASPIKRETGIICPDCGIRGGHAFGCPLAERT